MSTKSAAHNFLTIILLAVLGVIGYLWFTGQLVPRAQVAVEKASGSGSGILKTQQQFQDKLVELRMERDKVQRGVERLENLKNETIEHLKSKGINSGDDYLNSDDNDVKYAVVNLKEWVAQIKKTKKEIAYYDDAISSVQVMLDRIERERINESVGLSEEESFELQKIITDLNDRLKVDTNPIEDEALGKLLDEEILRD